MFNVAENTKNRIENFIQLDENSTPQAPSDSPLKIVIEQTNDGGGKALPISKKEPITRSRKSKLALTPKQRDTVRFISEILMAWIAFGVFMFLFVVGFGALLLEIFYLQSGAVNTVCLTAIDGFLGFANKQIYSYLFPTKPSASTPDRNLPQPETHKLPE